MSFRDRFWRSTLFVVLFVCTAWLPASAANTPFNRIVVLLDGSGSYLARQPEALTKTRELLGGLGTRKNKYWEKGDEILIVSMDALPEVIWRGSPVELNRTTRADWNVMFRARSDYNRCTDVEAALILAANLLEAAPLATEKYLFVFSDLIHEPPANRPDRCRPPGTPSLPGADFPWDRLAETRIAAFWLPPAQKMAWDRTLKEHGLTAYRLYTSSESATARVEIPPPARRQVSEEQRQAGRDTLATVGLVALSILAGMLLIALLVALLLVWRHRHASRQPSSLHSTSAPRRPVPPMRLPPQR